jgi:hypothetical protein
MNSTNRQKITNLIFDTIVPGIDLLEKELLALRERHQREIDDLEFNKALLKRRHYLQSVLVNALERVDRLMSIDTLKERSLSMLNLDQMLFDENIPSFVDRIIVKSAMVSFLQDDDDQLVQNFALSVKDQVVEFEHKSCNALLGIQNRTIPKYTIKNSHLGSGAYCFLNPSWPGQNKFTGDSSKIRRWVPREGIIYHIGLEKDDSGYYLEAVLMAGYELIP